MQDMTETAMIPELRKVLKRLHYPLEVMLVCARWYAAYPLSFRHLEEMMQERGLFVDHSTVHRWALKILPVMALIFRRRKRPVGTSWRMDETYIKVACQWKYLYRAVDKSGDTVDFLLTAKRDLAAARRYLELAINLHGLPKKITIDKSGVVLFVNHEASQTDLMKWADAAMYQAKDVGRNGVQFYCSPERNR
jgi:transposase-like protein